MRAHPLSRRAVLRGAGGIALALPFLQAMEARGQTAAAPQRLVIFYTPDGFYRPTFDVTGATSETQYNLSPTLSSLAAFKSRTLILDNLDQKGPMDSTFGTNGHDRGMAGVLTGAKTTAKRLAGGISIDQFIANRVGAPAGGFKSLTLGVETSNVVGFSRICFGGADAPVTPENSPQVTFDRIVAASAADPAAVTLRDKRKLVVDAVLDDYKSLRTTLNGTDKQRLEEHLGAVETLQTELSQTAQSCAVPAMNFSGATYPQQLKLQTDLLVLALKCDLTRVATLQASKSVSRVIPNWLTFNGAPITKEHHDLSHYGDGVNDAAMLPIVDKWYLEQFRYLLASLDAVNEGGKTLLDNSMAVLCTQFGLGVSHDMARTPFVIVGSGGGKLKTGRFVKNPAGTNHARLLTTLDRAMGGTATSFGDPGYDSSVLTGLLA